MKFQKTLLLGIAALILFGGIYYWTIVREQKKHDLADAHDQIIYLQKDQINYLEIQNKEKKFVFQKSDQGWSIVEPIDDIADNQKLNDIFEQLTNEKHAAIAKEGADINWAEFGLDHPEASLIFKNNLGQSQKISISATKNFEGQHYARVDSTPRILVVNALWYNFTTEKLVYFREKRLYRGQVSALKRISVKSLSDRFNLVLTDKGWQSAEFDHYVLDQSKIRAMIKNIAESSIQDYIIEGDPSDRDRFEKGLTKNFVEVTFETSDKKWSVAVNLHEADKALYALTEKPTYLVKLDLSQWELFGNLSLDSLRDRKTLMTFDISQVHNIFVKRGEQKYEFIRENFDKTASKTNQISKWKFADPSKSNGDINTDAVNELIDQVHNLEITYFLSEAEGKEFLGKDMVILKSADDQLLFQLNWGPLFHKKISGSEKDYYLARTQASDSIFGLNKSYIDSLPFDKMVKVKEEKK